MSCYLSFFYLLAGIYLSDFIRICICFQQNVSANDITVKSFVTLLESKQVLPNVMYEELYLSRLQKNNFSNDCWKEAKILRIFCMNVMKVIISLLHRTGKQLVSILNVLMVFYWFSVYIRHEDQDIYVL